MDETRLALRTAVIHHNVGVITRPGMFGDQTLRDVVDVRKILERFDAGEPIKDLLP